MRKIIYILFLILIIFRIVSFRHDYPQGKTIRITSQVVTDPVVYDTARAVSISGLRAYLDLFPEITYGDIVTLSGTVDGERLREAKIIKVEEPGGLYEIRRKVLTVYKRALPEPHAALLSGIVIGSKSSMPGDFWEKLKLTSTAHVVVASGMNVTFVISFVLNSLIHFINRKKALIIALASAWMYVFLSGFDAPLVRAAIMGSIAFGAQGLGRVSTALRALILSAAFMLFIKPEWARDLGFILSFSATLSLILFEAKISTLLSKVPFVFKKDLSTTLAAQIGVTPILYFAFSQFNILSPFINSLILWTIPPIMIIGALAGVIGLLFPALGETVALLVYPFTFWFIEVVKIFSS